MSVYTARLKKVEALLQSSPENASLISLRDDLRKMIILEASKSKADIDLPAIVATSADSVQCSETISAPLLSDMVGSNIKTADESSLSSSALSASSASSSSSSSSSWAVINSNEGAPVTFSNWQSTSPKGSLRAPPQLLTISTSSGVARLGSRIEGQLSVSFSPVADGSGGSASQSTSYVWYPGVVSAVAPNGSVTVRFIGAPSGTSPTVTFSDPSFQLRALEPSPNPPSDSELVPGALLNAKYTVDGKWYEARVDELLSDSVRVTYIGYGNSEVVPREYLCRMPQQTLLKTGIIEGKPTMSLSSVSRASEENGTRSQASSSSLAGAGGIGAGGGSDEDGEPAGQYEGLTIPENLRLLPTDTEMERLKKRKRVKSLKQAWKEKKAEDLGEKKASGWALFSKRQKL
jgi:hypothetical protein